MGLGAFRYFLAFLVLASHLWTSMPYGFAAYAVWGFFMLSGFLMTYVLNTKYGFTTNGIKSYFYNRALRIYPLYWIAMAISTVTLLQFSSFDFSLINPGFGFPDTITHWIGNLLLYPDYCFSNPVAVANALRIEVAYYFLMPFFARNKYAAWSGLFIGAMINIYLIYTIGGRTSDSFNERYATFWPCMVSFSLGSLLFHYKNYFEKYSNVKYSIILWLINGLLWYKWPGYPWREGLYYSLISSAWVIISLYKKETNKIDALLGDLSYPIYLLHSTIGIWLYGWFNERSFLFMLASFIVSQVVCYILVIVIDKPLRKLKLGATIGRLEKPTEELTSQVS